MTTRTARTLTVSIDSVPRQVYEFVSDARNLPRWSFFRSVTCSGDAWVLQTAQGAVELRFAGANEFGVLDHRVTPGSGEQVDVPMRVVPNADGSEVLLTVFQAPGTSDEEFEKDCEQVEYDLGRLKVVMEQRLADS
jgi:hypothetical protein